MSKEIEMDKIRIALAGNPNSGKTTLFNALTGSNQYVGNWPGVTVEKKEGGLKGHKDVIITDLPGIYSLSPYTLEEVVARNYLIGERPNAIINIIDGTNLERNLFLTTQLLELGIPMVCAVNMSDLVEKQGDKLDLHHLSEDLGCPVVAISALKETGLKEATEKAIEMARSGKLPVPRHTFSGSVEHAIAHIEEATVHALPENQQRWFAIKLFERDEKVMDSLKLQPELIAHIEKDIAACEKEMDDDAKSIITSERYAVVAQIIGGCYIKRHQPSMTTSDKIDRVVTNRWLAIPIFAAVMWLVYYVSITTVGSLLTDWVNDTLFGEWIIPGLAGLLENTGVAAWLQGLLVDGIVSGVGAVLGFVPQMIVLFLFLAFLEQCGYMARIAFILDRIFRKFGLSGKSFIPMLIGSGCGVPGIMASRTIENERDRRMTIMTTTFIPCGAKLPIIALIAGAMFGGASWVAPSAYFVGIAAIIISGIMLKKTAMFSGDPAPFVMELPAYHWPTVSGVLRSTWERASSFIKKAGTVILLATILVWFTSYFGWVDGQWRMLDQMEMDHSILAYIGNAIAWLFRPLGWGNWKAAVATITGLIAKENVVGTFGILYGFSEVEENGAEIWGQLQAAFTPLAAYSYLVFNLLCAPCFAAIGAMKREMNSAKWTWFAVGYQCVFAYIISLCIYQFGLLFGQGHFGIGTIVAFLNVALILYLLLRPYKESEKLTTTVKVKA
jgi:ferrous iron transport protein B